MTADRERPEAIPEAQKRINQSRLTSTESRCRFRRPDVPGIPQKMIRSKISFALISLIALFFVSLGQAVAETKVGEVAKFFTLKRNGGGKHIKLSDYEGQIVVLDFFAWWCGPCRATSPDVEKNVAKYFHDRGGNKYKVPVKVLGINIEQEQPARTTQFIKDAGLEDVADDFSRVAWRQFNKSNGIPLFVIINGVANSPSHDQWEVLYNGAGYPGAARFRSIIDTVKGAPQPPSIDDQPTSLTVNVGETATFKVNPGGKAPFQFQWQFTNFNIPGATNPKLVLKNVQVKDAGAYRVLVKNKGGELYSETVTLTVKPVPVPIHTKVEDGQITFSAKLSPAQRYAIEASPDLAKWRAIRVGYASNEPIKYNLGTGKAAPARFFRIRLLE